MIWLAISRALRSCATRPSIAHPAPVPPSLTPRTYLRISLAFGTSFLAFFVIAVLPALAARDHSLEKTIGTAGVGAGQVELVAPVVNVHGETLSGGSGVAVDNATHDIYVADTGNHRVDEFEANGTFVRAFGWGVINGKAELQTCTTTTKCRVGLSGENPGELKTPTFIAVDNSSAGEGDIYVADTGDNLITKFTSDGTLVSGWGNNGENAKHEKDGEPDGQLAGPPAERFTAVLGVAVDENGHLWDEGGVGSQTVYEFEQETGALNTSWPAIGGEPSGITVTPTEELYIPVVYPDVAKFTSTGGDLGLLFPAGDSFTGLGFDGASEVLYLDEDSSVDAVAGSCPPPSENCPVAESFGEGVLSGGAGLAVDPGTDAVFVANTTAGTVDDFGLEPPAPPLLVKEFDSDVTATSATLGGEIDPRSLPEEPDTEYWFEYGPCATPSTCAASPYPLSTPVEELPPSFDTEAISSEVQGLKAGVTYHFRLVAENLASEEAGPPSVGEEVLFRTPGAGVFVLGDDRAWEMVSPVKKYGALIEPIGQEGVIQAAANGGAITYHANQPIEPEPAGAVNEVQILSTRTNKGWVSEDIEPAHGAVASGKPEENGEPYTFFSTDLTHALLQPAGEFAPALSPEASEQTPFLRTDYLNGNPEEPCVQSATHCYRPLVTGEPGYANVPPGTEFGAAVFGASIAPCPQASIYCGPRLEGASADAEHVVFKSYAQLTEAVTPAGVESLYEWSGGVIQLVSVLPEGHGAAPNGGQFAEYESDNTRHAISEDGSRVVWAEAGNIYLRDTSPVSSGDPDAQTTTPIGTGEFQTANSEDTKIFFTDGETLYEYNVGAAKPLTALSGNAQIEGPVVGASENGSYLYAVANNPVNNHSEGAVAGGNNLYEYHDGETRLIAVLSSEDSADWAQAGHALRRLSARVSPDGRYLAFMSGRNLTGYNSTDASSGQPDQEVYEYDAQTGKLACASCEPSGARPQGLEYRKNGQTEPGMPLVGGDLVWAPMLSLAANVPGWTPHSVAQAAYQSRYLTDNGRLFFNSYDPLVPDDTNGTWDVYEYEPEGVGSEEARCEPEATSGSTVYKPAHVYHANGVTGEEPAGCVALMSSGRSSEESAFLDASETGSEVFFLTTEKLAPQDTDSAFDVYDAHECTRSSPCITPQPPAENPACHSEAACRQASSPPPNIYGAPATALFTAPGNITPTTKPLTPAQKTKPRTCPKGKVLKRGKNGRTSCVKKPKPRKKPRGKKSRT